MAEEMAIGLGGEPHRRTGSDRNRDREASRPPREGDPFAAIGTKRDVVPARRKLDRPHIALQVEQSGREGAAIVLARGGEAFALESCKSALWESQHGGAAREAYEKCPAVGVHP